MRDVIWYDDYDSWDYCERCMEITPHKKKPGGYPQCLKCLSKKAGWREDQDKD